jgi:hypothetical protein
MNRTWKGRLSDEAHKHGVGSMACCAGYDAGCGWRRGTAWNGRGYAGGNSTPAGGRSSGRSAHPIWNEKRTGPRSPASWSGVGEAQPTRRKGRLCFRSSHELRRAQDEHETSRAQKHGFSDGREMTERLPGWPWRNALPRRVDWSQRASRKPSAGNGGEQQDNDQVGGAERDQNAPPISDSVVAAPRPAR